MKSLLLFILSFFTTLNCLANQDCIWERENNAIKIKYITSCKNEYRKFDSFFNNISVKLEELKLPFPVLVLVNEARIGNEDNNSFASISFDTLASLDDDYIFNFYYSTLEQQIQKRNVPESYKLYDTLDINATASKKNRKIGLKIILNSGYSALTWDQLEKFILFGVSNVQIIKNQQQRIKVRYYANGYWVSMLSYDTVKLNTFLGWKNIERPNPIKNAYTENTKKEKSNKNLLLLFFAVLLGFSGIVVLWKKHYR